MHEYCLIKMLRMRIRSMLSANANALNMLTVVSLLSINLLIYI